MDACLRRLWALTKIPHPDFQGVDVQIGLVHIAGLEDRRFGFSATQDRDSEANLKKE